MRSICSYWRTNGEGMSERGKSLSQCFEKWSKISLGTKIYAPVFYVPLKRERLSLTHHNTFSSSIVKNNLISEVLKQKQMCILKLMKYSKDIYSEQNSVAQTTSFHWKLIAKLPKASEWKGSGKAWSHRGKEQLRASAKGQSRECLEVFEGGDHRCRAGSSWNPTGRAHKWHRLIWDW